MDLKAGVSCDEQVIWPVSQISLVKKMKLISTSWDEMTDTLRILNM